MKNNKPLKSVAIYLRGKELDPQHVSRVLRVRPSRIQKKGEYKTDVSRFIAKIGLWTLKKRSKTRSLGSLVNEVFAKIGNPPVKLNRIEGVEDAYLDILLAFGDESKHTVELELTNDQIANACRLGLSICINVM